MPQLRNDLATDSVIVATRQLIFSLARALVDDPDSVTVAFNERDGLATVILTVATSDLGKMIGKQGRTARSLRTILQAASMKHGVQFSLDIRSLPVSSLDSATPNRAGPIF